MRRHFYIAALLCTALSLHAQPSPYISRVWEYCPAPGQFINTMPQYDEGDSAEDLRAKADEAIADNNRGMICLGAWGGYVVFGFDHMVVNSQTEYDFMIIGNAMYAAQSHDESRQGGSSEPGIVMVSYDANGNGKPDDAWYELAGSEYYKPETKHHYSVTYYRTETYGDVSWRDSEGQTGVVPVNVYNKQNYYPLWAGDSLRFTGSRIADNAINEGTETAPYFVLYCYDFGYADNHPNNTDANKLCIRWAVDEEGNPVALPGIHFVKVYTAQQQVAGWLGETSTEISGAEDLHPDMETTGVESVESQKSKVESRKLLRNGTIYILRGENCYGIDGHIVK